MSRTTSSQVGTPRARIALLMLLITAWVPMARSQTRVLENLHDMLPADVALTQAVALGDVDGDGDLDVFVGNGGGTDFVGSGEQNSLYFNDGAGIFSDASGNLPSQSDPTLAVVLSDVDGDGDLDAFIGNSGQNRLYLNNGLGVFVDATSRIPADTGSTCALALGDVDGDGDLDVLLGNYFFEQNQLYLNDGSGHFVDATSQLPVDSDATAAVALGDVDGDGDLDALTGNGFDGSGMPDRLYLNDGVGVFSDATSQLPVHFNDAAALALADVDGDGDLDVFVGNGDPFLGNGLELNTLFLNDGSGVFADALTPLPPDMDNTLHVSLVDVDGDGDPDALIGNGMQPQQNRLYLNDGLGVFSDATAQFPAHSDSTSMIAVGDIDGDGDPDVLIANQAGQNRAHLNDGLGGFVDVTDASPPGGDARAVAQGDLDGDGDLDLFVGRWGLNQLLLNDGAGFLADASEQLPAHSDVTMSVALGDLDGDGDLDALIGNASGQADRLYLNDGSATFSDASFLLPAFDSPTAAVLLGDVDGDGDLDAYFANGFEQDRLLLNTGAGSFIGPMGLLPANNGSGGAVALVDVDADGDLDVLRGGRSLYRGNGNASFTEDVGALPALIQTVSALAIGDVDGDGDPDALLGSNVQNVLLVNDGSGSFSDQSFQLPPNGSDTDSVALGDLDGDGDLDALVGNSGAGTLTPQRNSLYLNDGSGTFVDASGMMPSLAERTNVVILCDLDGEDDLDAFIGNGRQNRIYRNLTRQVAWRGRLRSAKPFNMDLFGQPSAPWILALSLGTANVPTALGTLLLDPATLSVLTAGLLDAEGVSSVSFFVPASPALVGITVNWQAALGAPLRMSNLERSIVTIL